MESAYLMWMYNRYLESKNPEYEKFTLDDRVSQIPVVRPHLQRGLFHMQRSREITENIISSRILI